MQKGPVGPFFLAKHKSDNCLDPLTTVLCRAFVIDELQSRAPSLDAAHQFALPIFSGRNLEWPWAIGESADVIRILNIATYAKFGDKRTCDGIRLRYMGFM